MLSLLGTELLELGELFKMNLLTYFIGISFLAIVNGEYVVRGAASIMSSDLPGYNGTVPFKMYSGYLVASGLHRSHFW